MKTLNLSELPVLVIGAGPIGLAAAAQLSAGGSPMLVLEAGSSAAKNLETYRQTRLFSQWRQNVDSVAAQLLQEVGWQHPDPEKYPTAGELIDEYLAPLAGLPLIAPHLKFEHRITHVSRLGYSKGDAHGRDDAPFLVRAMTTNGPREFLAGAVIDASGTWSQPNPLGANGIPAFGEMELAKNISYGMPDVAGIARLRYAGKRVLVVGSGHSAVGNLLALVELAEEVPLTQIVWAIRSSDPNQIFGNSAPCTTSARGLLGLRLRAAFDAGKIELHTDFRIHSLVRHAHGIEAVGEQNDAGDLPSINRIDEIISSTGARPDFEITRELRLLHDQAIESTTGIASLIDPTAHSCGTVRPVKYTDLAHPETSFFTVGAKSYGRATNFLLATGYEQIRVVVEALKDNSGRLPKTKPIQEKFSASGCSTATSSVCGAT